MVRIFGPSGSNDIRSRLISLGSVYKPSVYVKLDLDSFPRSGIVNDPTGNRFCFHHSFAPTAKHGWKEFYIDDNRKRADKNRFED